MHPTTRRDTPRPPVAPAFCVAGARRTPLRLPSWLAIIAAVPLAACSVNDASTGKDAGGTGSGTGSPGTAASDAAASSGASTGSGSGASSGATQGGSSGGGNEGGSGSQGGSDGGMANGDDASGGGGDASNGGLGDGGQCPFVDKHWANNIDGYWFTSGGCYDYTLCAVDSTGNVACDEVRGRWTQTGCTTINVVACDGTMSTLLVQGPGADGQFYINGGPYAHNAATAPNCTCPTPRDAGAPRDGGGDADAGGLNSFLGPAWTGTLDDVLACGDAGTATNSASEAITLQPTASGLSFTGKNGCTLDFTVSGDTATLANPVTCNVTTEAGATMLTYNRATLQSSTGHSLTMDAVLTVSVGSLTCMAVESGTLTR